MSDFDPDEPLYVPYPAVPVDGRVTIHTDDYGPVTIDEPSWCNGRHTHLKFRAYIVHQAEDTHMVFGPTEILTSFITQRPFSPTDTGLYIGVEMGYQHVELDPAGLEALAAALVEHASVLRDAARRLAVLREAGQ